MSIALLILSLLATPAWPAERRCAELGENCVCSEPLDTTTYAKRLDSGTGQYYINPGDSSNKQCTYIGNTGEAMYSPGDLFGSDDPTAMSRLPPGHTNSHFAARRDGHVSAWWAGADANWNSLGATYNARACMRLYVYHSPDYVFRDDNRGNGCHSKLLQGDVGSWQWENFTGPVHMYQFFGANWGPRPPFPFDCCIGNPGARYTMSKNDWRGHWWRIEACVTNRSGPGVRHVLYMQDVSNGVPRVNGGKEFVASDWASKGAGGPAAWPPSSPITSSPPQIPMTFNGYRENHGSCQGWRGISFLMYAGWDTDADQRIGPAVEIESSLPR